MFVVQCFGHITHTHTHTHTHAAGELLRRKDTSQDQEHTTYTDLQHQLAEVDPVQQEVVLWSVREDSQHAGYRH